MLGFVPHHQPTMNGKTMDVCSNQSAAEQRPHRTYTQRLLASSLKKYKGAVALLKGVGLLHIALLSPAWASPLSSFASLEASASTAASVSIFASASSSVLTDSVSSADAFVLDVMPNFFKEKWGPTFYVPSEILKELNPDVPVEPALKEEAPAPVASSGESASHSPQPWHARLAAAQQKAALIWHEQLANAKQHIVSLWHKANQRVEQWMRPEVKMAKTQPVLTETSSVDATSRVEDPIQPESIEPVSASPTVVDPTSTASSLRTQLATAQQSAVLMWHTMTQRVEDWLRKPLQPATKAVPIQPFSTPSNSVHLASSTSFTASIPTTDVLGVFAIPTASIDMLVWHAIPDFSVERFDLAFYFPDDLSEGPNTEDSVAPPSIEAAVAPSLDTPTNTAHTWHDRLAAAQDFAGLMWQNTVQSTQHLAHYVTDKSAQAAESVSQVMRKTAHAAMQSMARASNYIELNVQPRLALYAAQVRGMYKQDPLQVGLLGVGGVIGLGLVGSVFFWSRRRVKRKQSAASTESQATTQRDIKNAFEHEAKEPHFFPTSDSKEATQSTSSAQDIDELADDLASWLDEHPPVTILAEPKRARRKKKVQPVDTASPAPAVSKNTPRKQDDLEEKQPAVPVVQSVSAASKVSKKTDAQPVSVTQPPASKPKPTKKKPVSDAQSSISVSASKLPETQQQDESPVIASTVREQANRPFKVIRAFTYEATQSAINSAPRPASVDVESSAVVETRSSPEEHSTLPADEKASASDHLKLELAKAYNDLGEVEGARTLLEEASRSNSEDVALEARAQLTALSARQVKRSHATDTP